MISLMYFVKIFPRFWSVAAFFRLMVAHFEWPAMLPLSAQQHEATHELASRRPQPVEIDSRGGLRARLGRAVPVDHVLTRGRLGRIDERPDETPARIEDPERGRRRLAAPAQREGNVGA